MHDFPLMPQETLLFTSESVGPGHPDKLCDQVSDAVLDACLAIDPDSRVAVECFATTNLFIVGGEVSTKAKLDYEAIVRRTLREIGYTNPAYGIDADHCHVMNVIKQQSPDIAQGVDHSSDLGELGAGDQGIMFGYACDETETLMPLAIFLAHRLLERADNLRKSGVFRWARPDMKSQVTIDYSNPKHPRVHTVLLSVQHDEDAIDEEFRSYIQTEIIAKVMQQYGFNLDYRVFINPTGRFVIGGPEGDTGLTGRKIIVDTYGGAACHGGGAFSGKDPTKVDRSAAYAARYIAKNIVAAGLAHKVQIQLSYAIGRSEPISIAIDTYGTSHVDETLLLQAIRFLFPLTPKSIIEMLHLRQPIYQSTAVFGHFGREELKLPWEKLDQVERLQAFFSRLKKSV